MRSNILPGLRTRFFVCWFLALFAISYAKIDSNNKPLCHLLIHRDGYSLSYDLRTKNAKWVYEKISGDILSKNIGDRNKCSFKEDPLVPYIFRSLLQDYKYSGYDRGHLAAAANHKCTQETLQDTFFLSNISPQVPVFNRIFWSKFEKYIRELTQNYHVIEIFTGPLYLPVKGKDGRKWVKYEVIGESNVAVPTHFYKVLVMHSQKESEVQAYILPNNEFDNSIPLSQFKTTIEDVQKAAGVIFFPNKQ